MEPVARKTIINAWNEWDSLKHVILGRIDKSMTHVPESAAERDFPNWGTIFGTKGPVGEQLFEQAHRELEDFAALLQKRGIRVDRPTPLDFSQKTETPDWKHDTMFGCMPPRDLLVCFGNEILEATMSFRDRWFEYLCYRPLLESYFKEDPNFVWEAAPKPRLTDETYLPGYWHNFLEVWSAEEKERRMRAYEWWLTDKEPVFDAADIMRFGKDVFVLRSAVTNPLGLSWLRRHLEPKGFRVHEMAFGGEHIQFHADCSFFAPRPGLLMQSPKFPPLMPQFHELFRKNGWEIVMAESSTRTDSAPIHWDTGMLAYNVLSLSPRTICVEAAETRVMDQLDKLGLEVVPVVFNEVAAFGGGLHCATCDIYREGKCEDYFPKQIKGY